MLFPLFGLPFILIGLFLLATPILQFLKDRKTVYAITSRRIIIIRIGRKTEYKSIYPEKIVDFNRREAGDGSGNLVVICREPNDSEGEKQTSETVLSSVVSKGCLRILAAAYGKILQQAE
jgi:hypothetical protein